MNENDKLKRIDLVGSPYISHIKRKLPLFSSELVFRGHPLRELVQYQKMWRNLKQTAEGSDFLMGYLRNIEEKYGMYDYDFNWESLLREGISGISTGTCEDEKDYKVLYKGIKGFTEEMVSLTDMHNIIIFLIFNMILCKVEKDGIGCLAELKQRFMKMENGNEQ